LQCVAVCFCVFQCVAVCCSALQCVAACWSVLQCVAVCCSALQCVSVRCSVLQCVAVCLSALQCVSVRCSVFQCVALCCRVLLCFARDPWYWELREGFTVAVCCSVLKCLAVCCKRPERSRTESSIRLHSQCISLISIVRLTDSQQSNVSQNGSVVHFNLDRDRSLINSKVPGEKTRCWSTSHTSQLVRKIGDQSQSKGCTCGKFSCHDDYAWVMSHMHESCHARTCRFRYGWVISHTSESCYIQMSYVTHEYEWDILHMNVNEPCRTRKSRVTFECVMSYLNASNMTSEGTYQLDIWLMIQSNVRMSRVSFEEKFMDSYVTNLWLGYGDISHMNPSCYT